MKYFVVIIIILVAVSTVNTYGWDEDSGYAQIEKISDIGIFDDNGKIIEEFTPNGALKITLQKGKKYFVKIKLINNGDGISMGYPSNTYIGKIRFILSYESGPTKNYQSKVFVEYDKQQFEPLEIKEYKIPISFDMFKDLSFKNTYTIQILHWDKEEEKRQRAKSKKNSNDVSGWQGVPNHKSSYRDITIKNKKISFYKYNKTGYWYYIFLSEEGVKEKYKYYDKNNDKFTYPQESDK